MEQMKLSVVHGVLIMGFVGEKIETWVLKECVKKFNVSFLKMVAPGVQITIKGAVVEKNETYYVCQTRADGKLSSKKGDL